MEFTRLGRRGDRGGQSESRTPHFKWSPRQNNRGAVSTFPRMIHTAVEQLTWPVLSTYTRSGSSLTRSGERDEPRWLQLNPER